MATLEVCCPQRVFRRRKESISAGVRWARESDSGPGVSLELSVSLSEPQVHSDV